MGGAESVAGSLGLPTQRPGLTNAALAAPRESKIFSEEGRDVRRVSFAAVAIAALIAAPALAAVVSYVDESGGTDQVVTQVTIPAGQSKTIAVKITDGTGLGGATFGCVIAFDWDEGIDIDAHDQTWQEGFANTYSWNIWQTQDFVNTTERHAEIGGQRTSTAEGWDAAKAVVRFEIIVPAGTAPGYYYLNIDLNNCGLFDANGQAITADTTWPDRLEVVVPAKPPGPVTSVTASPDRIGVNGSCNVEATFEVGDQYDTQAVFFCWGLSQTGPWHDLTKVTSGLADGNAACQFTPASIASYDTYFPDGQETQVWFMAKTYSGPPDRYESGVSDQPITVDRKAPGIESAHAVNDTVVVRFDEQVDQASAENTANYEVASQSGKTRTVQQATLQADGRTVELQLDEAIPQTETDWQLTVTNVQDSVGNAMAETTVPILTSPTVMSDWELIGPRVIRTTWTRPIVQGTEQGTWVVHDDTVNTNLSVTAVQLKQASNTVVELTFAADLPQNHQLTITAPAGIRGSDRPDDEVPESARKLTKTTPYYHQYRAGTRMVGLPLDVSGKMGELMGGVSVVFWNVADQEYGLWEVAPGATDHTPGVGCWAAFDQATFVAHHASGYSGDSCTVAMPSSQNFPPGWALIAVPWPQEVPVAGLQIPAAGGGYSTMPFAWYWTGTEYRLVAQLPQGWNYPGIETTLKPWQGYWVYVAGAGDVVINKTAQGTQVKPLALPLDGRSGWCMRVVASAGGVADAVNICGVGPQEVKVANPPQSPAGLDLYFVEEGQRLAVDVKAAGGAKAAAEWTFAVRGAPAGAQVTIGIPDMSRVPAEYAVVLTDLATGERCWMRTSPGYTFTSPGPEEERRFKLEVVPRSDAALVSSVTVQQAAGGVVVTYQLNAEAVVTVDVLNIAGRLVKRVVSDRPSEAGVNSVLWNLTGSTGAPVPRGTYIVVIRARTADGQQVKAVRTLSVQR